MLIAPQLHHCSQQTHAMTAANTTVSYSCKCNRGPANLSTSRTTHVHTNQRGWPHPDNTPPSSLGDRSAQLNSVAPNCTVKPQPHAVHAAHSSSVQPSSSQQPVAQCPPSSTDMQQVMTPRAGSREAHKAQIRQYTGSKEDLGSACPCRACWP